MKERILKGWNIQRVLFPVIGMIIIIQAYNDKQWMGALLGAYFVSMGIFRFGCASGRCVESISNQKAPQESNNESTGEVEFEEVKIKK
jgi:hypothetical protein